ncbi:hypothetical protein GO755_24755 [Spirosoma sp. HMF4905]|uniref:Uncharacterized protein n=1 Tax=Spirosoma arboris TaxID=2682092 RepID=A0A7K1SHT7_9BACT|nr:hypothetical protein [Spirosoma arboris]MVM33274.1 hypothetical protein [Spirosoma arboris]
MLTIKTPDVTFTVPTEWPEVTLKQFIDLSSRSAKLVNSDLNETQIGSAYKRQALEVLASDANALIQVMAGIEDDTIDRMPFLSQPPDFLSLPVPEVIAGVKPPQELGMCTLFQKWTVDEFVNELADEELSVNYMTMAVSILSVYLYPALMNARLSDRSQLTEITAQIEALPVTEALPLAHFFLTNYRSSTSSGQTTFILSHPKQPSKTWRSRWFLNWKPIKNMRWYRPWLRTGASPLSR